MHLLDILAGKTDPSAGYQYRRLADNVSTGIYECNKNCKCKSTCLNRVAQVSATTIKIININFGVSRSERGTI